MDYSVLNKIEDKVYKSLDELAATPGTFSATEVENAKNAVCLLKEINEVKNGPDNMTSMRYDSSRDWQMPYPMNSFAPERGRNALGQFTSRDGRSYENRGPQYSYHNESETEMDIREMMRTTTSEEERRVLRELLDKMERRR